MEKIPVAFYDGKSSAPHNAGVYLQQSSLLIEYASADGANAERWHIGEIKKVDISNGIQVFRYGDFPQQVIECSGYDLAALIKAQYPASPLFKSRSIALQGLGNIIMASILLVAMMVSIYFYVLPPLAAFLADQIPQEMETQLGGWMLNSFLVDSETDEELSGLVNQFARQIDFQTTYPIEVTVVKSDEVNAFAVPGGKIVVFDGILKKMKTAEVLAALLSHEVAHVEHKHSLKSISRSLAGYMFISIIFNDLNGISTILVDNANMLNNLSYSRSLESDADTRALRTLEVNKISQKGMVGLFETLNSKGDFSYLKFLSTHPLTGERIKHARLVAAKQKEVKNTQGLDRTWKAIQQQLY